jgi:hypothetical protein
VGTPQEVTVLEKMIFQEAGPRKSMSTIGRQPPTSDGRSEWTASQAATINFEGKVVPKVRLAKQSRPSGRNTLHAWSRVRTTSWPERRSST